MPVISVRASEEWVEMVDAEAERMRWSRNAAIVNLIWQILGQVEKKPEFRLKMIDTVEEAKAFGLKVLSGCRKCKGELTNKRCMNSQCVLFNREQ